MLNIPHAEIDHYLAHLNSPACAFIYDLSSLSKHVEELVVALPEQCQLSYAVKANSDARILQTLAKIVSGFDVASLGEIEKVRDVTQDAKLALGGPAKTANEFRSALAHNTSVFHIESLQQLRCLNEIADAMDQQVEVLLRVNPDIATPAATIQMGGVATQFGIEQAHIHEAIALSKALPAIHLCGFHFHAISNNLNEKKHLALVEEYMCLVSAWQEHHRLKLRYINVGGGIGVNYADLSQQFDWPLFCAGLDQLLTRHRHTLGTNTQIVFECGRYLSAFCGYYLTEVVDIKRNHGENFALLRGGSHHFRLPVSWQHNHPFEVVPAKRWPFKYAPTNISDTEVTLCGELCTPKDVLARRVHIDTLAQGDCLVFVLAGAYGWHISHHDFLSHPHPEFIYKD